MLDTKLADLTVLHLLGIFLGILIGPLLVLMSIVVFRYSKDAIARKFRKEKEYPLLKCSKCPTFWNTKFYKVCLACRRTLTGGAVLHKAEIRDNLARVR